MEEWRLLNPSPPPRLPIRKSAQLHLFRPQSPSPPIHASFAHPRLFCPSTCPPICASWAPSARPSESTKPPCPRPFRPCPPACPRPLVRLISTRPPFLLRACLVRHIRPARARPPYSLHPRETTTTVGCPI